MSAISPAQRLLNGMAPPLLSAAMLLSGMAPLASLPPPEPLPGGGGFVALFPAPIAPDQVDDVLLLVAAQIAIGSVY